MCLTENRRIIKTEILSQMINGYSTVTANSALAAFLKMYELHSEFLGVPNKCVTDSWKPIIDDAAAKAMEAQLNQLPFCTKKVGSEGAKEIHHCGKAASCVLGVFGDSKGAHMIGVSDVVEGTTPASQLRPGASSVIAVVPETNDHDGIRPTPPDTHYLIKFIGPKQARDVVDLNRPHIDNLLDLILKLNISPEQLTQVTLNPLAPHRQCNQIFIDVATKLGVKVLPIDGGDFIPGVLAASSDPKNYVIVVGRGGYEEGTMAAVAAKALGGFMQAQEFDAVDYKPKGPILTLDDLVQGASEEALVCTSFITHDDMWFHKPGIRMDDGRYFVNTMSVTHKGIIFRDLVI